jgi:hypothetical protein
MINSLHLASTVCSDDTLTGSSTTSRKSQCFKLSFDITLFRKPPSRALHYALCYTVVDLALPSRAMMTGHAAVTDRTQQRPRNSIDHMKSVELEQSLLILPQTHTHIERLLYDCTVLLRQGRGVETCSSFKCISGRSWQQVSCDSLA